MREETLLKRFYVRSVAIGAFGEDLLVQKHRLSIHQLCLNVTFVTGNARVAAGKRQMGAVVVEDRGSPPLRVVAIGTRRLAGFRKLPGMGVFVTVLTDL